MNRRTKVDLQSYCYSFTISIDVVTNVGIVVSLRYYCRWCCN